MGCYDNIGYNEFPKQGSHLGKKAEVCFHFNTNELIAGKVVRDDMESRKVGEHESPGLTIIELEDGRYVLATECQYSIVREIDDGGPYYGLAKTIVPMNHRLYYKVNLDASVLEAYRNAWRLKSASDKALYTEIWQDIPGAVGILTERETDGLHYHALGVLMEEGFDIKTAYMNAVIESSKARYNKPAFNFTEQYVEGKKRIIAVPRKNTTGGRAFLDAVRSAEMRMELLGCTFAEYVLIELDLENILGIDPNSMQYIVTEAHEVGNDIWISVPSLSNSKLYLTAGSLVDDEKLLPMRYSEFVAAQEDAYIAAGNYNGSDTEYHAKK